MQPAVWGAVRDDGSRRPAFDALRTIITRTSDFSRARFIPVVRDEQRWPVWPEDPNSYWPNWQAYVVVFDLPGARRVTVVWNGDGEARCVNVSRSAGAGTVVDKRGAASAASGPGDAWSLNLSPATAHFVDDPDGYYFIGGDPLLLVEDGVPDTAPLPALRVGCA
jgi:hypothetical protein